MVSVQSKLDEWKRQLLDLSKRNRLLYFRETKLQTLRVDTPGVDGLFERLVHDEKPLTVIGLDDRVQLDFSETSSNASESPPPSRSARPGEIVFSGTPDRVAAALYTLRSRSRTELEERGVGVLFLALGFLHWYEADQSSQEIVSPILLVPVDLQRDTPSEPYRLVPRNDDVVVNPTLSKSLEDQFGVTIPEVPGDDAWSLSDYLRDVAAAVSAHARWRVERLAYLGVFSFLKLSMYRDLELGLAVAENSPIVRALAGDLSLLVEAQSEIEEIPAAELDERVDPQTFFQVLDADSSQQQAIELAKAGASFVLQGPPGTGKSQTIANIIAETVGLSRTVLFVSEKAAALDVVHRRLTQVGLSDGCLALHSHKANKRDVVAELARVYRLGKSGRSHEAFDYERLAQRRSVLNEYVNALHLKREPLCRSVFEVEGYLARLEGAPDIAFPIADVEQLTFDKLEFMKDAMARLSGSADAVASLVENPWRGCVLEGQSLEVQRVTGERLGEAIATYQGALQAGRVLGYALRLLDGPLTPSRIQGFVRIADALAGGPAFMGTWLEPGRVAQLIDAIGVGAEKQETLNTEASKMHVVFDDSVLEYDLDGLSERLRIQYRSAFSRMGGAYRTETKALSSFTPARKRPPYSALVDAVPAAVMARDCRRWFETEDARLRQEFGEWYAGSATDWAALRAAVEWAGEVRRLLAEDAPEAFRVAIADILANRDDLLSLAGDAGRLLEAAQAISLEIVAWFDGEPPASTQLAGDCVPLDGTVQALERLEATTDQLPAWTRLWRAAQACAEAGAGDVVPFLQAASIPADQYVSAFERRAYSLWLDYWINKIPALRDFESASHAHVIAEFRRLDRELRDTARRKLRSGLAERRPDPSGSAAGLASSQPALLMKEAKKKRRHKPLRRLLAEIPDLLVALKPCLMMSPLSVGQFLSLEASSFDVVIFDEASQVKPEDAVGAIMRGKQVIVVGDSKQLPPTTFFDVSVDSERDEDDYYEDETGVFESVLDVCSTVGLPERMLAWHYRSRHEGLIAFSNHFLYEDRLVTFPAPEFDGAGTGVELRYLADGVYERGRAKTNQREVEEVMRVVREHASIRPGKSLGVVAFSQAQMTAIDRALWRLRSQDPAIESFVADVRDERFFVKNLENVQGDERDVIVFSVGYGKDAAGKLEMKFGPLNNRGGERRLNVAVTRARESVVLVSSIRGMDIDVSRSQAEGVRLLKHYLDYAERGVDVLETSSIQDPDADYGSPFEEEVGRVLESLGYRVVRQVGCSGYRIDLAVVHPSFPGVYALGIECDGATYHSAATARERDRLREEVLRARGWRLYRIWSTDWYRARAGEVERLRAAV